MLIQPHLAIFLDRFLRVRTNPLIHVLIFLSDTFIHGLSFVINIDAGGGYRPGDGYGYGYDDRVSGTKLISCLSVIRDLIEQGPRRRRRGAPPAPVSLSGSMSRRQIQVSWLRDIGTMQIVIKRKRDPSEW